MLKRSLLILAIICLTSTAVYAKDFSLVGPFPVRIQNPLYLLFINLRPVRPVLMPKGDFRIEMTSAYSNLFERYANTTSQVDLDMEIWRVGLFGSYGLSDDFEVGMELPFLHFEGGFLDSFIQNFHNAFGLPNAGRETFQNGVFDYQVQMGATTLFQVGSQTWGLSDIELYMKHKILSESKFTPAVSGSFHLKLPTGVVGEALGSGAPDFGFVAAAEKSWNRLHGYLNLGYFVLGGHKWLDPILNEVEFTWMTAMEINIIDKYWSFLSQISGDTSLFHGTGLSALDRWAMDLVIGFGGEIKNWWWKVAFIEDPLTNDPAVDFTVFVNVGLTWGPGVTNSSQGPVASSR